jgi:hypothetical protein
VGIWTGLPGYLPSGAARPGAQGTTVYASWNGATQLTSWNVLAGTSNKNMTVVAAGPKAGFETQLNVKGNYSLFEVQAVNSKGQVVGTSKAFGAVPD